MPNEPVDPDDEPAPGADLAIPDLGALGALIGGEGGDDPLGGLLAQAQQMMEAQAQAAEQEVEGVAGGGVVRIRATGTGQVLSVSIDPDVVDPSDVSLLEDLVLAALHDAVAKAQEAQAGAMGGLDMGGLGGILGP